MRNIENELININDLSWCVLKSIVKIGTKEVKFFAQNHFNFVNGACVPASFVRIAFISCDVSKPMLEFHLRAKQNKLSILSTC